MIDDVSPKLETSPLEGSDARGPWRPTFVQAAWRIGSGFTSLLATFAILYGSGASTLGTYAVSWTITVTVSILVGNGLATAISWSIASRHASAHQAMRAALPFTLLVAVPFLFTGTMLGLTGVMADRVWWLAVVVAVPAFLFVQSALGVLQGEGRTHAYAVLVSLQPITLFLLALAFWIIASPIWTAGLLLVSPAVAQAVVAYFLIDTQKRTAAPAPLLRSTLVMYTRRTYLGAIASLINTRADLVLIGAILGPAAAGTYSLALTLGEGSVRFAQSAGTVLFARAAHHANNAAALRETHRVARASAILALGTCLGLAYVLHLAASVDPRLGFVSVLLAVLSVGIAALALSIVYNSYFFARGMPHLTSRVALGVAPFSLVAYSVLIPSYGLVGGAVASCISYAAIGGLSWIAMPAHVAIRHDNQDASA